MFSRNPPDDPEDDEIEEEEDEDEHLELNEAHYRQHRSRVRSCSDLEDLADMRAEFSALAANRGMSQAARLRARDLVQYTNDRIAEVRARRNTGGG